MVGYVDLDLDLIIILTLVLPHKHSTPNHRYALRLMSSNAEVDQINQDQVTRYAHEHGKPVLFWRCVPTIAGTNEKVVECMSTISCPGMIHYFVENAPCFVTKNTYMEHGIANGTRARLHSIVWEHDCDRVESFESYSPGQLVEVTQPLYVNIEVEKIDNETSAKSTIVVPMPRVITRFELVKYNAKTRTKAKNLACYSHNVTLGFAVTYYKSQGQTLDRVILHLHKSPGRAMKRLDFEAMYVALSRVKQGKHIRTVFGSHGLQHLSTLQRSKYFDLWLGNYHPHTGVWNDTGFDAMKRKERQASLTFLTNTKNLYRVNLTKLKYLVHQLDVSVKPSDDNRKTKIHFCCALHDLWLKYRSKRFKQTPRAKPTEDELNNRSKTNKKVLVSR